MYIRDISNGRTEEEVLPDKGKDKLNTDALNALPQPLMATFLLGDKWPVYDIEPQCAILRIDVCGMLDVKEFCEVVTLTDVNGEDYDAEDFWYD